MELNTRVTDEQELIAGCKDGKQWAQKAVYEQYAQIMLSVCYRYVNDRETARDLLQDGFIKLFTKINSYSGLGAFAGWVRRIFVTTALEYLRQTNALKLSSSIDEYDHYIEDDDVPIIDKISADDLMKCVGELPNGYRTVFNLYAIEGYSHQEIANILSISENTSRTQFMRARKLLQKNVKSLFNS